MWTLIVERIWFFYFVLPGKVKATEAAWNARSDTRSWYARQVRAQLISEIGVDCRRSVPIIKSVMAILPLLGLLGTVTGMIKTFQSITLFGAGDPKMMAGGISEALVTTMLGLIVAIPLVFLHSVVASRSRGLIEILEEQTAGIIARQSESGA
jgi:biopolymer transport protein ExbB